MARNCSPVICESNPPTKIVVLEGSSAGSEPGDDDDMEVTGAGSPTPDKSVCGGGVGFVDSHKHTIEINDSCENSKKYNVIKTSPKQNVKTECRRWKGQVV